MRSGGDRAGEASRGAERLHSPAAERNAAAIAAQFQRLLPDAGCLLEIASGTGQHAAHIAPSLPRWRWLPSDLDPRARASVLAWCDGLPNVAPPLTLDVLAARWEEVPAQVDAVWCANLLHIAPWDACGGLMRGAARHLAPQGLLLVYGPFIEAGVTTAPSNLVFDADLRARNASWGLRALTDVDAVAAAAGLVPRERVSMPANNLLRVWARG